MENDTRSHYGAKKMVKGIFGKLVFLSKVGFVFCSLDYIPFVFYFVFVLWLWLRFAGGGYRFLAPFGFLVYFS